MVFLVIIAMRAELSLRTRLRTLLVATLPMAFVAAVHTIGRLAWSGIVRTDADMPLPTLPDFNGGFWLSLRLVSWHRQRLGPDA